MMPTNTRFSDIVLEDNTLSMTAKGVFVSIGYLGNGCTLAKLLERTTNSADTVSKALTELEQGGYISFDDNQGIHIPASSLAA